MSQRPPEPTTYTNKKRVREQFNIPGWSTAAESTELYYGAVLTNGVVFNGQLLPNEL